MPDALPPLLDPDFEGMDAMRVELPAPGDPGRSPPAPLVLGAAAGLMLLIALLRFRLSLYLGAIGLALVLAATALGALQSRPRTHTLRFLPGRLQVGDQTLVLGEIRGVRWVCEPPVTTLILDLAQGQRLRLPCARRGPGGGRGVTRKQREWIQAHIERGIAAGAGEVPAALTALVAGLGPLPADDDTDGGTDLVPAAPPRTGSGYPEPPEDR